MKIAAFCLCWLLILTAPGVMAQQANVPNQSWEALRILQAEMKLEIWRKTSPKKDSGKFVSLSDDELVIERKGKTETFGRDEVKFVWLVTGSSRLKKTLLGIIGGGIGFLVAIPIAIGIDSTSSECDGACLGEIVGILIAFIGLPIAGALIGVKAAGSGKRASLIYSAP
jgi:hypothetical protein